MDKTNKKGIQPKQPREKTEREADLKSGIAEEAALFGKVATLVGKKNEKESDDQKKNKSKK